MSDSINVRVTLDSYDLVHPSQKQTQVYVQIPEVGRASWLLDADSYAVLKDEPWPHVIDSAHEEYERRGVVSDSASEAARKAIVDWLLLSEGADYDERYDAVQAAWELDQARRHPVARKLLAKNEQLLARVAELEQRPSVETVVAWLRYWAAVYYATPGRSESGAAVVALAERAGRGEVEAWRPADRLTALLAPTQSLREPDVSVVEDESTVRLDITPAGGA